MNSFNALWAVAEGSRWISMVWFRQTHSSIASETNCCLVMPRKSHCLVSHSNCFELTSIRSAPPDRSGSSGDDPDSLFRTHQIAGRTWIGFKGICAIIRLRNVHLSSNLLAFSIGLSTSHQPGPHTSSVQSRRLFADFWRQCANLRYRVIRLRSRFKLALADFRGDSTRFAFRHLTFGLFLVTGDDAPRNHSRNHFHDNRSVTLIGASVVPARQKYLKEIRCSSHRPPDSFVVFAQGTGVGFPFSKFVL
jgi:hypothetical protein